MLQPRLFLTLLLLWSTGLLAQENFVHLVENKGQWPAAVIARADLINGHLYLEKAGLTYCFVDEKTISLKSQAHIGKIPSSQVPDRLKCHAVKVDFVGALTSTSVRKLEPARTKYAYFTGNDKSKWAGNVSAYSTLDYENLYTGIDLKFYSVDRNLKYDLVVKPGGDPAKIILDYKGATSINIRNNNLNVQTSINSWQEMKPYAYQLVDGKKQEISCNYSLSSGHLVKFTVGDYNKNLPLIIDPLLVISTYSGSTADNFGYTATYDSQGFMYAGSSALNGPGYPVTAGAFDISFNGGNSDVAITKYDTTGTFRIYSTLIGGSGSELPHSLIVDSKDQLIIFGTTGSGNFPTTADAIQKTFKGGQPINLLAGIDVNYDQGTDLFVTKLSFDGSALLASTYLGGSGSDGINHDLTGGYTGLRYNYADEIRGEVLTDDLDNCYIVTTTYSTDIPMPDPGVFQSVNKGKLEGVIFKLDYSLNNLLWSSYLGGSNNDAIFAIDINKDGIVVVSGGTISTDLSTNSSSIQRTYGGGRSDGFIALIGDDGQELKQLTYWGGPKYDQIYLHEFGPDNNLYVFGQTEDNTGKFSFNHTGFGQAGSGQFITKFSEDLDSAYFSLTFGNGIAKPNISPTAFLVDNCGNIYTTGWGGSINSAGSGLVNNNAQACQGMPVTPDPNPLFRQSTDGNDFHIMVLDQDANSQSSGFYFGEIAGDDHVDGGTSRFDKKSQIYQSVCASCGGSQGFPTTPGAASSSNNGTRSNGSPTGCNNAVFKMDFESAAVSADFTWTVASCKNDTINFSNRSFNGQTYSWDFGDGSPLSTGANPFHIYPAEGVYFVTLYSTNPTACNNLDSITKRVVIYPIGKHILSDSLVCLSDTLQLGFTAYPGATYDWSPGTGLSDSTDANPFFFPANIDNYTLIINGQGCIDTTKIRVTVDGVVASFDPIFQTCLGDTVFFNNKSVSADRYLWNFGDTTVSSGLNPFHVYSTPGVYQVSLFSTTFDPGPVCNPLDSAFRTVVIYPTGFQQLPDSVLCRSDTVQIGSEPLPGASYKWTPAFGLSSDIIANPFLVPDSTREYTLVMNAGPCSATSRIRIIVEGVKANFNNTLGACEDDSLNFTNKSISATSYYWDFGDGNSSTLANPRHAWQEPGVYNVRLVSSSSNAGTNCPGSDSISKLISIFPDGVHQLPDSIICRSDSTQIGYDPIPGAKYKWTPPNGLSSDIISNPYLIPDTTYNYTLVITALTCTDTTRLKIIPQGVLAAFASSKGTCDGDLVKFTNFSLGANSYLWDFGDNSATSNDTNPTHLYPAPGIYTVTLKSATLNPGTICGAIDSVTQEITVYPAGIQQLPDTLICRSDTVQIGFPAFPGTNYQWIPSNGLSSDTISNPLLMPDSTRQYVLISQAFGCVDSAFLDITTDGVLADFSFTANLCQNDSIRFSNLSIAGDSFIWRFGDGTFSTQKNVAHSFSQPGIYPVTLFSTTLSPGLCLPTDSITKNVVIFPAGNHPIPDTTICRSDTVQIGYPSLPGATYIWTPANGVSDPTIADPFFYPDNSSSYTLVSIASGCVDTTTLNILIEGVLANFTSSAATCDKDTIFFTNSSQFANSYSWNFGDGTALSTDTNPNHVYASPGRYTVTLIAMSTNPGATCGASDTLSKEVIIYPVGKHMLPDTLVCAGDTLQFTIDSLPGTSYAWSPGFGLSDSLIAQPFLYYSIDTTYTLIARAGACFDTTTISVKGINVKLIPFSLDTLICSMPSFELIADGDGAIINFTWSASRDFSNPINSGPQDSTVSVIPTTLTTYYVKGESASCVFTDSIRLLVATGVTTNLPDLNLCFGDSANIGLSTTMSPGETYTWTPVDGLNNPNIPYPLTGISDSIQYKLTAVINGCFEYFLIDVNVQSFDLIAYGDSVHCDSTQPILLIADGDGGITNFYWSDNQNFSPILNPGGDSAITVFPPSTITYFVKGKSLGCSYLDSVLIRADYIKLGIDDSIPYCFGKQVILDADNMGNSLTYKWTPNTHIIGPDDTEQITVVPTGVEKILLTATNPDGCVAADSITISPTPFSFLTIGITASDSLFYKDRPIIVQAQPSGNYTYTWEPASYFPNPNAPSNSIYSEDSIWAILTVSDGFCPQTDSLFLKYSDVICGPPNVFIPNAFTPNTDSENDVMRVRGSHIELLYFAIYDRWGERVFETNDQKFGWDGTMKGKPLDPAVFVYYLQMTCKDRQTYFEKGNITLIR